MSIYLRDPETGKVMLAEHTQRPTLRDGHGHVWKQYLARIDDQRVWLHSDNVQGRYLYFEFDGTWYRVHHIHGIDYAPGRGLDAEFPTNWTILVTRDNTNVERVSKGVFDEFVNTYSSGDS